MGINVSLYSSHDASICFDGGVRDYRVIEFERILKQRYASINNAGFRDHILLAKELIDKEYGFPEFDSCYYGELKKDQLDILKDIFGFIHFEELKHHFGHAAGALYQSPFEKALIISSDSGGSELDDGIQTFGIFYGDKEQPMNQVIKHLSYVPLDVCGGYTLMAVPISEIKKEDVFSKYLSYAGKIMGLAAYGKIRDEWIEPMKEFYYGLIDMDHLSILGNKIGFDFSSINTVSGQNSYDIAATSQHVFEEITLSTIRPFIGKYRLPIILTGGGALNVLLNQRIKDEFTYPVFVPVNPNDCGLSFGFLMLRNPAEDRKPVSITYSGVGITDVDKLQHYIDEYKPVKTDAKGVARYIARGNIVGILNGNSECGPRALGNRSILCMTYLTGIKERLNELKQREFFRPFAPVVRKEDAEKYFIFSGESQYMSFCPDVNPEYIELFKGIVHKDYTSRLQTVTKEQNDFLYTLVDAIDTLTQYGILLNTSFNIKGKPMLTTVQDAIESWKSTSLDGVYINGYLFVK